MTLEAYGKYLKENKPKLIAHRRAPAPCIWANTSPLQFEDRETIQYRFRDAARRKSSKKKGIQSELDAYNPLIPDGSNWKATMLIEYADINERHK